MTRIVQIALVCVLATLPAARAAGVGAGGAGVANGVSLAARDLPLGGARTVAATRAPGRFDLVGLHWRGSGSVSFRTRSVFGRWSPWRVADDDTAPDPGTAEARSEPGWHLGSPVWTGPSDRIDYRTTGRVRRLRAYFVSSPVETRRLRTLSTAGSPPIISRSAWGGDELPRRNQPHYAPSVRFVVIHHTATPNAYTPGQAAAIVRGIDVYHVKANGWDDIGYNFVVDKFGRIYEGRAGGITRNVIGAHALGFNKGSVGIALIGNYMTARPSAAALTSIERLVAWRLDLAHVDPASTLTFVSGGSERWRPGVKVKLRAVSGHRDTGSTSCPGTNLYPLLNGIAKAAQRIGLPKLYAPLVLGKIGGPVVFSARLSGALPWTITVAGPTGKVVGRGSGVGPAIAWTWNSAGFKPGKYTWTMEAGPSTLPARGLVGGQPLPPQPPSGPLLTSLTVTPGTISPNGDGYADTATIGYTLTGRATVTATVVDAAGTVYPTPLTNQKQAAGPVSLAWSPDALPDGAYSLVISAVGEDGRSGKLSAPVLVDRVLSSVTASPAVITPNGDGIDDSLSVGFVLAGPAETTVTILAADGSPVASVFSGPLEPGTLSFTWNGLADDGTAAPPGTYQAVVGASDPLGTVLQSATFEIAPGGA